MKKNISLILILILFINGLYAKKPKQNPFQIVDVPDSIYKKIEKVYIDEKGSVNAGIFIWNLSNKKDYIFKNGIYSYRLMGPHFPRRIFIFKTPKIYIFKSIGAFDSVGVIQEYLECIKLLELTETERVLYLKSIANYLKSESGLTYGTEMKKNKK